MVSSGLSLIFIRILIFIYALQSANVRWNGSVSDFFSLSNGVKQGGVLSAILYCFYCNDLFKQLREMKSGCWINGEYMGILGYSDDNLLIAPSRCSLQSMLSVCEEYARVHNRVSLKTKNCSNLFAILHVAVCIHIKAESKRIGNFQAFDFCGHHFL